MVVAPRPWTKLVTLFLIAVLVVMAPVVLSSCQSISVDPPPQTPITTYPASSPVGVVTAPEEGQSSAMKRDAPVVGRAASPPSPQSSADAEGAQASAPEIAPAQFNSGTIAQNEPEPQSVPAKIDTEESLDPALVTAYDTLIEGEFFHTIPSHMNAGQQLVIQAGVSEQVNQTLLTSLNLQDTDQVTILDDARFNPLGMRLTLSSEEEVFTIEPISTGFKPVIQASPETWEWLVTPRKSGNFPLRLTAFVRIDTERDQLNQQEEMVLFSDAIPVRRVPAYTWQQLVQNYLVGLVSVGFSILCVLVGLRISYVTRSNRLIQQQVGSPQNDQAGKL